jgi:hypothetical protein
MDRFLYDIPFLTRLSFLAFMKNVGTPGFDRMFAIGGGGICLLFYDWICFH